MRVLQLSRYSSRPTAGRSSPAADRSRQRDSPISRQVCKPRRRPSRSQAAGAVRTILLFTDGQPDEEASSIEASKQARDQGIRIAAIRRRDAATVKDPFFKIAGDETLVFAADAGRFGKAFEDAEKRLSLGDSSGGSWLYEMLRFGMYSGMRALGIVSGILAAQNAHVRKPW